LVAVLQAIPAVCRECKIWF
jgi:hypothetical protein